MATRTPGLQPRSQYHAYWGIYGDGTTQLPNQTANPLASPGEFDKLEEGDIAYSNDPGNEGLYVCTDPGGPAATPAATWVMLAMGGAVVQTTRDAHQIVVGQDTLTPFADVVGVDADFVDPGDGTQLQTALTTAAALAVGSRRGVDVRLRPCSITLPTSALTMGRDIKLIGADRDDCVLIAETGTVLSVDGINNVIEGLSFSIVDDGAVGENGLVQINGTLGNVRGVEVRRCLFSYDESAGNPFVNTVSAVYFDTATVKDVLVEDTEFKLSLCQAANGDRVGTAVTFAQIDETADGAIRVESNRIAYGDLFFGTVNGAEESSNPIVIRDNVHANAGTGGTGRAPIHISFNGPTPGPKEGPFRGPEILGNEISMFVAAFAGSPPSAIVRVETLINNQRSLRGVKVVGNTLYAPNQSLGVQKAVFISNLSSGTPIEFIVVGDNVIEVESGLIGVEFSQFDPGFTANDAIRGVTVVGNVIRQVAIALQASKQAGPGLGAISKVTFNGNACFGTNSAQMVASNSADNTDFAVIGNASDDFVASALDPSGTFEVAHNV